MKSPPNIGQNLKEKGFLSSGHVVNAPGTKIKKAGGYMAGYYLSSYSEKARNGVLLIKNTEAFFTSKVSEDITHTLYDSTITPWAIAHEEPLNKGICFIFEGIGPKFQEFQEALKQYTSPLNWENFVEKTIYTDGKTTDEIKAEIDSIEDIVKPDLKYLPILFPPEKARAFLAGEEPKTTPEEQTPKSVLNRLKHKF